MAAQQSKKKESSSLKKPDPPRPAKKRSKNATEDQAPSAGKSTPVKSAVSAAPAKQRKPRKAGPKIEPAAAPVRRQLSSARRRVKSESRIKTEVGLPNLEVAPPSSLAPVRKVRSAAPKNRSRKRTELKISPVDVKAEVESSQQQKEEISTQSPAVSLPKETVSPKIPPKNTNKDENDADLAAGDPDLQSCSEQVIMLPTIARRGRPKISKPKLKPQGPSPITSEALLPLINRVASEPVHQPVEIKMPRRSRKRDKPSSSLASSPKSERPSLHAIPCIPLFTPSKVELARKADSEPAPPPAAQQAQTSLIFSVIKKKSRSSKIVVQPGRRTITAGSGTSSAWMNGSSELSSEGVITSAAALTSSSGVSSTIKQRKRRPKNSSPSRQKRSPTSQLLLRSAGKRRRRQSKILIYEDALLPLGDQQDVLDEASGLALDRDAKIIASSESTSSEIVANAPNDQPLLPSLPSDLVIMKRTSPLTMAQLPADARPATKPSTVCCEMYSALARLRGNLKILEDSLSQEERCGPVTSQCSTSCTGTLVASNQQAAGPPFDLTDVFWLPFTSERQFIWSDGKIERNFKESGHPPEVSTDILHSGLLSKTSCSALF